MSQILETYLARTPGSRDLYERSSRVVPGGVHHAQRYYPPYPIYMRTGGGATVRDVDGHEYLDLWNAHYAAILGHAPAFLIDEMRSVVAGGTHFGIPSENEVRFAELLVEVLPGVDKVRFGVSGTEATMYATRLARAFTNRPTMVKVIGGWHGANTDLSVAIRPPYDVPESAGLPRDARGSTKAIPFNDIDGTRRVLDEVGDDLAGIIVEPVQGMTFVAGEPEYLSFLRDETHRRGAVLIFDEIIVGFRLELGGARAYYDIQPDLSTYGKVAGGGFHLGLVAGRDDIMSLGSAVSSLPKGQGVLMAGGTYSCNPLSMVGGRLMVEHLRDHAGTVYPYLDRIGARARAGLSRAFEAAGLTAQVTGVGSLASFHVLTEARPPFRAIQDAVGFTDHERGEVLQLALLNEGVHTHGGKAALSTAYTEADVDELVARVERAARATVAETGGN